MDAEPTGGTSAVAGPFGRGGPDPARKAALLHAMRHGLSLEEIELDRRWRVVFGGPLPILGDPMTAGRVLGQAGKPER